MNIKQDTSNYYVFSQTTLNQAITEWIKIEGKKNEKNKEIYLITAQALPWLLKHFNQTSSIYTFTHVSFMAELDTWKFIQVKEYPHQKKLIEETCDQLLNFFESEIVIQHKMLIEA